ncbi:hypothetical protein AAZX31_18G147900, partial [Glycine max]
NYQGLDNPSVILSLRDLVRSYHVDVLFLCETLVLSNQIEEIKSQLGFNSYFFVDVDGRSGGLALFWKDPFNCHLLNFSSNFINVQVHHIGHPSWRRAGFYGILERQRR